MLPECGPARRVAGTRPAPVQSRPAPGEAAVVSNRPAPAPQAQPPGAADSVTSPAPPPAPGPPPAALERLTTWRKIAYGAGGISSGLKSNALGLFLLYYYTDVMLLAPLFASYAIMAGRVWDAASDVVIGQWSDRFEHPAGRRRVFIIRSALPYAVFMWAIWAAPPGLSQAWLAVYLGVAYVCLYTASTLFTVPYYALGAEIAEDYDERTSVSTWRTVFYNFGALIGSMLPALIVYSRSAEHPPPFGLTLHQGWSLVGFVFALLLIVGCVVPYWFTREPKFVEVEEHPPILKALRVTFRNKPFRIVIASSTIKQFGWTMVGGLLAYISQYWLYQDEHLPGFILIQIAGGALSLPLWARLSATTSKLTAYRLCLNMLSIVFLLAYWLAPDRVWMTYALMGLGGAGVGGNALLSTALIADVCDLDELATGRRREGMFFAVWWFCTKLASALGIVLVGVVLDVIQYTPNVQQNAFTIEGFRAAFGPGVALFFALGALIFATYPLTRASYHEVREQLEEQRRLRARNI